MDAKAKMSQNSCEAATMHHDWSNLTHPDLLGSHGQLFNHQHSSLAQAHDSHIIINFNFTFHKPPSSHHHHPPKSKPLQLDAFTLLQPDTIIGERLKLGGRESYDCLPFHLSCISPSLKFRNTSDSQLLFFFLEFLAICRIPSSGL